MFCNSMLIPAIVRSGRICDPGVGVFVGVGVVVLVGVLVDESGVLVGVGPEMLKFIPVLQGP